MPKKKAKNVRKKELARAVFLELRSRKGKDSPQLYVIEDVGDCLWHVIGKAITEGDRVYLRKFGMFRPIRSALKQVKNRYNPIDKETRERLHFYTDGIFEPSEKLLRAINTGGRDVFSSYFGDSPDSTEYEDSGYGD